MEAHRVRRTAAGDDEAAVHLDGRELPLEAEHERVDAVVGGEEVRAEADHDDSEPLARARTRAHLPARWKSRGRANAAAGPPIPIVVSFASGTSAFDLDRHCTSPSTIARAIRHGSPTPNVITTSPGRAQASASRAASSRPGAQPRRVGSGTRSRTSLPLTP